MSDRAVSPVLGVILLVALTVITAGVIALFVTELPDMREPPVVTMEGTVNASDNTLTIVHTGGDSIAVDELALHVTVDEEPLTYQPPVPFESARGYSTGPSGPLHSWGSSTWEPGEESRLQLAGSNEPLPTAESRVAVEITYADTPIAELSLTHE